MTLPRFFLLILLALVLVLGIITFGQHTRATRRREMRATDRPENPMNSLTDEQRDAIRRWQR